MAFPVTFGDDSFTAADFAGFMYARTWERFLSAFSTAANRSAEAKLAAEAARDAAAASLAAAQTIVGAGYGVGPEPTELPRPVDLGSAAFVDAMALSGVFLFQITSSYQIGPLDHRTVLVATASGITLTLPIFGDVPAGWSVGIKNRSGGTITLARNGANLNGAGSDMSVADGTILRVGKIGSAWETC